MKNHNQNRHKDMSLKEGNKTSDFKDRLQKLSPEKRELLNILLKEKGVADSKIKIMPQDRKSNAFPLSFGQQRLWFIYQFDPKNPYYNETIAFRIKGKIDQNVVKKCVKEIVRRHQILRTSFQMIKGELKQVIESSLSVEIPIIDVSTLPKKSRLTEVRKIARGDYRKPFELDRTPLLRLTMIRLEEDDHVIIITTHHIICDGWSQRVFLNELLTLYQSFAYGQTSPLRNLSVQYADYSVWQRQWIESETIESQVDYWRRKLVDVAALDLPADKPRPTVQTFNGSAVKFKLPKRLAISLKKLNLENQATLFMTLLAAFNVLIYRYTQSVDIAILTPISGRNRKEIEELIGFFVNTLVLRTDLSGNPTFTEALNRSKQVCLEAYDNQDVPFEKLVEALSPERDISRHPFAQIGFALQKRIIDSSLMDTPFFDMFKSGILEFERGTSKMDLTLSMQESQDSITGEFEFNTDLFDKETIKRMAEHYRILLEGIVKYPDHRISELNILSDSEFKKLVVDFNDTKCDWLHDNKCVHELFEEQVEKTPDNIAVVFEDQKLTYKELNTRANQLAHYLIKLGVRREFTVGILVERSIEMVVGLLSVLKAGGAYLPIDPDLPSERIRYMVNDSGCSFVITKNSFASKLPIKEITTIFTDGEGELISKQSSREPGSIVSPDDISYIIYTSGSTGAPKGVLVSHGSLASHALSVKEAYDLTPGDNVLQISSIGFDTSIEQIIPTLISGARVVIVDSRFLEPRDLMKRIELHNVTVANLPTPYWSEFVNILHRNKIAIGKPLRIIIVGGDVMPPESIDVWEKIDSNGLRLLNAYGPTEAVITSTLYEVRQTPNAAKHFKRVPIGRPVGNRTVYVLDYYGNPVPIGVPGELCIGGDCIASGYLNRPELSAEKFVPDPFSKKKGSKLYRTGDNVRYLKDGNIDFLGRRDNQVKIRGYRIELGEIESVLRQHPNLKDCAVTSNDYGGDKRLVAYVVLKKRVKGNSDQTGLKSYLKRKLPQFMIPSYFVFLDKLPLTTTGKVDRKSLPSPTPDSQIGEIPYKQPDTETEKAVVEVIKEVLGIERLGVHDSFFDLGGHSLLATQVISRLRDIYDVELPLLRIFENPTVFGLAKCINEAVENKVEGNKSIKIPVSELRARQESFKKISENFDQLSDEEVDSMLKEMLREEGAENEG